MYNTTKYSIKPVRASRTVRKVKPIDELLSHSVNTYSESLQEELRRDNNRAKFWYVVSIIWIVASLLIASIILKN